MSIDKAAERIFRFFDDYDDGLDIDYCVPKITAIIAEECGPKKCVWKRIPGIGYSTSCGLQHQRPIDIKELYKYCCYCGGRIEVK